MFWKVFFSILTMSFRDRTVRVNEAGLTIEHTDPALIAADEELMKRRQADAFRPPNLISQTLHASMIVYATNMSVFDHCGAGNLFFRDNIVFKITRTFKFQIKIERTSIGGQTTSGALSNVPRTGTILPIWYCRYESAVFAACWTQAFLPATTLHASIPSWLLTISTSGLHAPATISIQTSTSARRTTATTAMGHELSAQIFLA